MTFGYDSGFGCTNSVSGITVFALDLLEWMRSLRQKAEEVCMYTKRQTKQSSFGIKGVDNRSNSEKSFLFAIALAE